MRYRGTEPSGRASRRFTVAFCRGTRFRLCRSVDVGMQKMVISNSIEAPVLRIRNRVSHILLTPQNVRSSCKMKSIHLGGRPLEHTQKPTSTGGKGRPKTGIYLVGLIVKPPTDKDHGEVLSEINFATFRATLRNSPFRFPDSEGRERQRYPVSRRCIHHEAEAKQSRSV